LKKIGPGKARVGGKLVQTKLKSEGNWSRQSYSFTKFGPYTTKVCGKLIQAKLKFEEN
jgi:hypothetical protein